MMRLRWLPMEVLVLVVLCSSAALAQTSTGTIAGVVQDESAAVIPGAKVTITDVDTGISRSVVTDAGGRYRVPSLIPDRYAVQVEMAGFETGVRQGIQLTVGGDLAINMVLKVGQVSQKTVVTAEAPMVETMTGTVSGLVDDKAIRDLPLNGRSFDQLIALEASAPTFRVRGFAPTYGTGHVYTVHGARDQHNRYLLDGTEVLGAAIQSNVPGGSLGFNMGVEAIREFSVLTSNAGAAYGKKMGGIINMATRSGTNELHGSAFEFLRNDNLDARNFFDVKPGDLKRSHPAEFKRNQFGGALGGPIRRDRTFFFATYEGLREGLGISNVLTVPDDNARQGLVSDSRNPGQFVNIGVAPGVKPFLAAWPVANGRIFGDGTAEALFSSTQVGSQNFYLGRVDHRLSDKDSLFARYNFSNSDTYPVSNQIVWGAQAPSTLHVLTLAETRAYSTIVNTIRAGFTRATVESNSTPTVPLDSSLVFYPGARGMGSITFGLGTGTGRDIGGAISGVGASSTENIALINLFAVGDEIFHQRGPHALQMGVQVQRIQNHQHKPDAPYGIFQFTSLGSFLSGEPREFRGPNLAGAPDPTKAYRQTYLATYLQDDYRVRRNLTLNLGLRWEFMTPPTEASGNRIGNYHVRVVNGWAVMDSDPTVGAPFYASRKKNFAPRVGFAWDIFGDGKTAVRGGFGMFYDQIETEFKTRTTSNAPFYGSVTVADAPFPLGFSGGPGRPQQQSPEAIDFGLDVPTRLQYNLNVQRQITPNTAFTIGYVGSEAYHLTRMRDVNSIVPEILPSKVLFYPATGPRFNPALGTTNFISTDATSSYQGLDLEVTQRLSHGLRYKVSFTYSKTLDSASIITSRYADGAPATTMQPDDLRRDRGLSAFDLRRNLVTNWTYDLPWINSASAAARWIGGWQVGAILTLSDGAPFTAITSFDRSRSRKNQASDRPDLLPGKSNNPVLGGPDKYYDPTVFALPPAGTYGNVGRNTLITPGFANVDLTLTKLFPVSERLKVDFRAEFFNFLNHANFGLPSNAIFNSNGTIRGTAGRINSTVSTSRQIQFGLKVLF